MRKNGKLSLFLGTLLAGVLSMALVACSDDDDDGDGNGDAEPTATQATDDGNGSDPEPTATTDDGNDDGDAEDDNGNGDGNGDDERDPLERLREAADNQGERTMSVTYEIEFDGEIMTMQLSSDPPRQATHFTGSGELGTFATIDDGENSYWCSSDAGEEMCIEMESGGGGLFGEELFQFEADDLLEEVTADADMQVTRAGSRTIAGQSADCYEFSGVDGDGVMCVSGDNIVLLIEGTFEGETIRMEVTEYSDQPDDSAFEPPYEVMSMGDFMNE